MAETEMSMCLICGNTVPVEVGPGEGVPHELIGRFKLPVMACPSPDHCRIPEPPTTK